MRILQEKIIVTELSQGTLQGCLNIPISQMEEIRLETRSPPGKGQSQQEAPSQLLRGPTHDTLQFGPAAEEEPIFQGGTLGFELQDICGASTR